MARRNVFNIREIERSIRRELKDIGDGMQEDARTVLRANGTNASGVLSASIKPTIDKIPEGLRLTVGPEVSYGAYVETGTRPHMPPVNAIKDWIAVKFRGAVQGDEHERMAWAVAHKIRRHGTEAQPYMSKVFRNHEPHIAKRLAQALTRAVDERTRGRSR